MDKFILDFKRRTVTIQNNIQNGTESATDLPIRKAEILAAAGLEGWASKEKADKVNALTINFEENLVTIHTTEGDVKDAWDNLPADWLLKRKPIIIKSMGFEAWDASETVRNVEKALNGEMSEQEFMAFVERELREE